MRTLALESSLWSLLLTSVHAVNLSVRVRTSPYATLQARDSHSIPVHNTHNAEYIANITLGGREIPVLLDTGSSDLWVTGDVPGTKDLGKAISVSYAVGMAAGDINSADLDVAGYHIPDQAYLLVKDTSTFSLDIKSQGFEGLIGLGPNTGSVIENKLDGDAGNSVLNRIFSQNSTSANYMSVLLDRKSTITQNFTGQLTISELVPGYEKVTSMPKLDVDKVHRLTDQDQHWQAYTDAFGVIGPDGQPIAVKSIVPSAPKNQLIAVFDSGYTLPQVPRAMSDAIYGRVQGAEYSEALQAWTVPCTQLINLSFMFGGVEYPIHPLDVSSSDFNIVDSTGKPTCLGTFQPITSAFSLLGEYDIILGMAFLRNAYALFDYGDWVDETSNDRNDPFIQLLSTTDKAAAHNDFVQVRLGGVDTTNSTAQALLPADQGQKSPISSEEKKKLYEEKVLSRWPEIFVGCLGFVLIMAGLITWRCCVRRKRRRAAAQAAKLGLAPSAGQRRPETFVDMNSSSTHLNMHQMGPKQTWDQPYTGYESEYKRGSDV
ncbi:aspartic peptidase A1 [Trametopsis cervina]|nr:aspartic peptidase A1 [Trametopsis cervina]